MTLRVKSNDVLKIVAQVLLTVAVCTVFWAATSVSKTGNGFVCLLGDEYCLHTAAGNSSLSTSTDWKADGKKVVKGGPLKCPPLPMDKTSSNDELHIHDPVEKVRLKMERIRRDCGQVCDTRPEQQEIIGKKFYNMIRKDFPCCSLFGSKDFDAYTYFSKPPKPIPQFLMDDFTYHGQVKIINSYRDDSKGKAHNLNWTEKLIEDLRAQFRRGALVGGYGKGAVKMIYDHLTNHMTVKGLHVLVIGSQNPWLEAVALEAGASKITTLEYLPLKSSHPQVVPILPADFASRFLNGTLDQYDAMVTFSSLEHSGLGRYGDGLNPYGDLITMARAWCVLKDGGYALVGVPSGEDLLTFNSDRIYGRLTYSHLFANFEQVYTEINWKRYDPRCSFCYMPVHVIRKNTTLFRK